MSVHQTVTGLDEIQAPWNKQITLDEVTYEGGFAMVRLRIKEGRRITDLELDPDTARRLGQGLMAWAAGKEDGAAGKEDGAAGKEDGAAGKEGGT